ncbi:hypothetical protein VPH35_071276 [Triticum aestivum]
MTRRSSRSDGGSLPPLLIRRRRRRLAGRARRPNQTTARAHGFSLCLAPLSIPSRSSRHRRTPTSVLSPNPNPNSNSGLHSTAGDPSVPLLSLAVDPLEQRSPRSDQILAPETLDLRPWRPAVAQVGGATMDSSAGDAAQVLLKARCSFFLLFLKFKGKQQHTPSSRRTVLLFSDGWMDGWMGWSWRRRTTRRIGIPSLLFSSSMPARNNDPATPQGKAGVQTLGVHVEESALMGHRGPPPIRTGLPVVCTA